MQPAPRGPQLPSIRTLHPYLPPPPPVPAPAPGVGMSSSASASGQHANPTPVLSYASLPLGSSYAGSDHDAEVDRDGDDGDGGGSGEPPKKKRRRQALSCTECKRRKIRCDRTQPCAPCVRRGDQAKCQWHVVEPVTEKYVPRAEHDALRARVDALEAYISRLPTVLAGMPPWPVPSGSPDPHNFNAMTPMQASPTQSTSPQNLSQPAFSAVDAPAPPGQGGLSVTSPPQSQSLPPMQFRPPTLSPRQSFSTMSPPPPPLGFPPHAFHSSGGHGGGISPAQTQHVPQRRGGRGGARRASGASSSYGDSGQGGESQHRSVGRDGRRGSSASGVGNTPSAEQVQPDDVEGIAPPQNQSQSRSGRETREGQPLRPPPPSFPSSPPDRRASFSPTSGRQHQHWGGAGFGAFPAASGAFGPSSMTAGFASGTAGTSSFHSRPTSSGSASSPPSSDPSMRGSGSTGGRESGGSSFSTDSFHARSVTISISGSGFPPSYALSSAGSFPTFSSFHRRPYFSPFPGPSISTPFSISELHTLSLTPISPHPLHARGHIPVHGHSVHVLSCMTALPLPLGNLRRGKEYLSSSCGFRMYTAIALHAYAPGVMADVIPTPVPCEPAARCTHRGRRSTREASPSTVTVRYTRRRSTWRLAGAAAKRGRRATGCGKLQLRRTRDGRR